MTTRMGKYSGLCEKCGRRRHIRTDGKIGEHPTTKRMEDCEGGYPISTSERCEQCKVDVGRGSAHKMDCSNPKQAPTGRDTR
jgi:hypothetical protein